MVLQPVCGAGNRHRLKDATSNTPFMLIARNQSNDWQQYNIKQNGDDFVLTPKAAAAT